MATNPKPRSSSCLSFLKDALLLPSLNPKLFLPVLILVSFPTFLTQATSVFAIQPFTAHILELLNTIKGMDPSAPEYAKLMAETMKDTRELLIIITITIVFSIAVLMLGFAKQVVAFFAASSTYTGDRYSLPELNSKVITKGHRIRGSPHNHHLGGPSVRVRVPPCRCAPACDSALGHFHFRHRGCRVLVAVRHFPLRQHRVHGSRGRVGGGRSAAVLRQAWRLMTRVWRKEGCVLAVVVDLLSEASWPLYMVALRCAKTSTVMGLPLLSVCAAVSGVVQLFCYDAAMVYYYRATQSKVEAASPDD